MGEHLRGDHRRDRNRQLRKQIRGVDVGVHQLDRGVDLALRRRGDAAAGRGDLARRLERAESGRDDGQPLVQPGHQRGDRRVQLEPAVEDDARQRRKALRRMGTHHREHDVGAVAGGDDRDAVGEPFQHVLGGHARDQHVHHFALEQLGVAADDGAVDGALKVAHRGRDQQRLFGQHIRTSAGSSSALRRRPPSATGHIGWPPPPRCGRAGRRSRSDTARRPGRPRSGCGPWP